MLKLKRVELQGFKSFCDRTEMRFHGSGVAAVVGPNGCGKSNLADAINWVLGEQSAKSLRGTRMEDVIFAGTRDRKPLGMAQVTLTLVDPEYHEDVHTDQNPAAANGTGPRKAKEIVVARRLFRSGESEYLVDGKVARLRDIQDLFMGTGLGPESYAIIEQGRIGQILSTKPADRRGVIEEAAGVTRFKTKRRLAEAKLEGAKQNLNRVFDILEEVSRQVNSLKRQASKARRYEELRTEMVEQLRITLAGRFRALERDTAKTALDLNAANTEWQELAEQLTRKEAEETALREQHYQTESNLTEARKNLAELRVEAERTRGRLESQAAQIAQIEQRLGTGEGETAEIERRVAEQQAEMEAHSRTVAELAAKAEEARGRLQAKAEERNQLQGQVVGRERELDERRQQVLRLLGEVSSFRNRLAQIDTHLASMEREAGRVRQEETNAQNEIERLDQLKREIGERLSSRQLELQSTGEQRSHVEQELNDRKTQAAETRRSHDALRGEVIQLKARKDYLEEILSHRAYTTESVKRLFGAVEKGETQGLKPSGVLADFVEVDPRFEKAAEEFLHDELEYVVVKSWEEARMGVDLMRADLDGRATFLVHPEPGSDMSRAEVQEPVIGPETGIVARLSEVLRLTNGLTQAPSSLLPRLARCFIADSKESAQRLALQYPDVHFLLADGVCYHGYAVSGGKKTGAGPLALKRELRDVTGQEAQRRVEMNVAAELAARLDEEIAGLTENLERLRAQQQNQEKEALALGHEQRKLAEEYQRASQKLSVARLDLERIARETERAGGQKQESETEIATRETARSAEESALAEAREALTRMQAEAQHIAEEHAALRAEMAGMEERSRAAQTAHQRLEAQTAELVRRKVQLAAELERFGVDRARLLADNIELDQKAATFAESIGLSEQEVAGLVTEEEQGRLALAALGEALKLSRAASEELREKRTQIELELVRKQSEMKFLDETCKNELDTAVAELAASVETPPADDALAAAEDKYRELKGRIEALGPVNPQALEEYEEAQKRYDFLNTQRQDLLDSIRDTEKAIQEIDQESKKRFNEAFGKINENFREMFKILFNGGVGEMRLTDPENPDSGIDIVAQPPGKKLQNVLLMSGGERAMTAMSLLMAIFKYQPSPFCILDEVDAPLDEPNIIRLTKLVKEMSEQTQFIVITHAKRTMEASQVLYGVTMQEPGVSKLVSVKFNPLSAAVPPPAATTASAATA